MMVVNWRPLAGALVGTLEADGVLVESAWRQAFAETPRHLFVPSFLVQRCGGTEQVVNGADAAARDHWLTQVYSDTNLITQIKPSGPRGGRRPTSSSSMPSIMAWMLHALELSDGQRVLEIGTGTGYNAALLCHRLGATNVVSIDLDPALVDQARKHLAELGYAPLLAVGDGADGVPDAAPYDAILATAAVDHIPPAWIEQLRPGGIIVTDLRGGFSGTMVRLRKIDDDTVEGRCDDHDAAFMPMRRNLGSPLRQGTASPLVMDRRNPQRGTTTIDLRLVGESRGLRFLVELQLGAAHAEMFVSDGEVVISAGDGSWATATLRANAEGTHPVAQAGPCRLWDSVEAAVATWHYLGKPTLDAFGVTATSDTDDQRVWVGNSKSAYSWPLPI
ncbi:MAG TPA: methyltransferase domain-containing protein [Pseudonocardiaceae bacterium]|nr:methyltransferase domain-containing protein [Pseudonocardiaceae bacterium]